MKKIIAEHPVSQGYTCAHRRIIEYSDGSRVFAKTATNQETTKWLRKEFKLYELMGTQGFLAELIGWEDDGEFPTLYLEDLSGAHWPPIWRKGDIEGVIETLAEISNLSILQPHLQAISASSLCYKGWQKVSDDPEAFLSLGFCSESWLKQALPTLLEIQQSTDTTQQAIVHRDLRSDNLCFAGPNRIVFIDWNWASLGSPIMDIAFWAPSLRAENGPLPEELIKEPGPWAVNACGLWASQAGLPQVPEAPFVRHIQKLQLSHALPWVQRIHDLPFLDGKIKLS